MAEEGRAAPGSRCASSTTSATTSRPARSGSRWPRSASARSASPPSRTCSSRCSGRALGHTRRSSIAVVIAYLLITVTQSIVGEIVPKLYTIQHAEGLARRIARPLQFFRDALPPVHRRAERRPPTRSCGMLGTDPDAEPEGGTPDELKRIIAESQTGGQLDVGRGEHAHRRLPPARAGGAPGDDADPGGRHRRPRPRPSRTALRRCVVDRSLAAGRHRGREPGPGQGASSTSTSWSSC